MEPATAPRKPSAKLIIDGGHLLSMRGVDVTKMLQRMEEVYRVTFVKKILIQGTHDGQLNSFHRMISSPDGGHVACRIYGMKLQKGYAHDEKGIQLKPRQTVNLVVEKGVDVGIAVELLMEPLPHEENFSVIVLVSGDSDLGPALNIARVRRKIIVCSKSMSCSPELNEYIEQFEGKPVFLDTLFGRVEDLPTTATTVSTISTAGTMFSPPRMVCDLTLESSPTRFRGAMKPWAQRPLCISDCPQIKVGKYYDLQHVMDHRHPCHFKSKCRVLHTQDTDKTDKDNLHMELYMHTCLNYFNCPLDPEEDPEHFLRFTHIPKGKQNHDDDDIIVVYQRF